jgi:hypothetical protein
MYGRRRTNTTNLLLRSDITSPNLNLEGTVRIAVRAHRAITDEALFLQPANVIDRHWVSTPCQLPHQSIQPPMTMKKTLQPGFRQWTFLDLINIRDISSQSLCLRTTDSLIDISNRVSRRNIMSQVLPAASSGLSRSLKGLAPKGLAKTSGTTPGAVCSSCSF